ncbi:MAG: hypothetical protein ACLRX6_03115 [Limosilactobacillus pontis]|uniref:hypothetical protein n=1 Tax=Limosilactobacillus pontis TaxID=35787 RepID=UPI00399FC0E0
MDNLSANANDVIDILLNRSKEQERMIAILQANLQSEMKKNKDLQARLDKVKDPETDQSQESNEGPNNQ